VAAGADAVGALFFSILSSPKVDEQSIAGKREEMLQDLLTIHVSANCLTSLMVLIPSFHPINVRQLRFT